ncbi:cytochrome P450 [Lentzea terrae]|uniref:cytochrome P450 n=1 Tax=Lentzea terrae TaxID=2200761 RepID=UPI0013002AC8|nr:cytochrome P450 [Lentzea terrae]
MPKPKTLVTGLRGYQNHAAEAELRESGTVHLMQIADGTQAYVVTAGLKQSRRLLADDRLSKACTRVTSVLSAQLAATGCPRPLSGMFNDSIMFSDQPVHTRLRALVTASFNAQATRRLEPRAEELVSELVEALPAGEQIDLISRFAFILPITIICEVLGVPVRDRDLLHAWTSALVLDDPARTVPASTEMTAYLGQLVDRKRREPADDLCSRLVHASIDGDQLSESELLGMLFLLVVGGHETTSSLIGNLMLALLTEPSRWRQVVQDPSLIPSAIEETLRWDPPTARATHRVATQDIEVGGEIIPAGGIVLVSLSSAGRDPHTPRADEFDLQRPAIQHVGFGHGIHNCVGSQLARMQAAAAIRQLAARFPTAELMDANPPRLASSIVGGVAELQVRFTCG